jgi:tRNA-dihydrouridine synthase 3
MGDQLSATDPEGGLKIPLQGEQLGCPDLEQSSTGNQSATTNGEQIEGRNLSEPASKRIKLDHVEQLPTVDARDKVKGIALIKPE